MANKIDLTKPVLPVGQPKPTAGRANSLSQGPAFAEILRSQLGEKGQVQFSKHARERLENRGINLTAGDLLKLNDAVEKAARKGARESLVLLDNLAFIVSIASKTVVTAVDGQSMKEHVFTNIDSAVIL
jgi:flagellar operon protein